MSPSPSRSPGTCWAALKVAIQVVSSVNAKGAAHRFGVQPCRNEPSAGSATGATRVSTGKTPPPETVPLPVRSTRSVKLGTSATKSPMALCVAVAHRVHRGHLVVVDLPPAPVPESRTRCDSL